MLDISHSSGLTEVHRNHTICFLKGEVSHDPNAIHIRISSVLVGKLIAEQLRLKGAAFPVHLDCAPHRLELVVAVVEQTFEAGRVPCHHDVGTFRGEGSAGSLEDALRDPGSLIHEDEDVLRMEALQSLWLLRPRRASHTEAFLRRFHHLELVGLPHELVTEIRQAIFELAVPEAQLCPQNVGHLGGGGSCAAALRGEEACVEPEDAPA